MGAGFLAFVEKLVSLRRLLVYLQHGFMCKCVLMNTKCLTTSHDITSYHFAHCSSDLFAASSKALKQFASNLIQSALLAAIKSGFT